MKDLTGWRRRGGDSHESEGDADTFYQEDTCKTIKSRMVPREDLFQEDVTTAPPYLENVMDVPGCTAIYME
jgi:hypothetical protein